MFSFSYSSQSPSATSEVAGPGCALGWGELFLPRDAVGELWAAREMREGLEHSQPELGTEEMAGLGDTQLFAGSKGCLLGHQQVEDLWADCFISVTTLNFL